MLAQFGFTAELRGRCCLQTFASSLFCYSVFSLCTFFFFIVSVFLSPSSPPSFPQLLLFFPFPVWLSVSQNIWWYFLFLFFFNFYFIFKLYIIVLVLPNIKMNLPQVYMCSPSRTLLPPPSPYHPSGSSQCTSPKHPVSCIEPGISDDIFLI